MPWGSTLRPLAGRVSVNTPPSLVAVASQFCSHSQDNLVGCKLALCWTSQPCVLRLNVNWTRRFSCDHDKKMAAAGEDPDLFPNPLLFIMAITSICSNIFKAFMIVQSRVSVASRWSQTKQGPSLDQTWCYWSFGGFIKTLFRNLLKLSSVVKQVPFPTLKVKFLCSWNYNLFNGFASLKVRKYEKKKKNSPVTKVQMFFSPANCWHCCDQLSHPHPHPHPTNT